MRVINFAHGEFYMLGGYAVWVVMTVASGLPLPIVFIMALIIGPIVVGFIGFVLEVLLFRPMQENPFAGFMASLGLAYVLQVLAAMGFGVVSKSLPSCSRQLRHLRRRALGAAARRDPSP